MAPQQGSKEALALDGIRAPVTQQADALANEEVAFWGTAKQKEEIADLSQDREERKRYAKKIYRLVVCWLATIMLIVLAQGFGWYVHFELSNSVMIALVGSTTGSVVGIFIIVTRYLFARGK